MFDSQVQSDNTRKQESGTEEQRVVGFYADVLAELQRFGPVTRMEVRYYLLVIDVFSPFGRLLIDKKNLSPVHQILQNQATHLRGNVYAEFGTADSASKALQALRLRWYGGRLVDADLVPMSSWEAAVCGAFLKARCARGNEACNYMHTYDITDTLRPQLQSGSSTSSTRKDHDIIVDYYERTASQRGSGMDSQSETKAGSKKRAREEGAPMHRSSNESKEPSQAEDWGRHRRPSQRDYSSRTEKEMSRRPTHRERSASRERHRRRRSSSRTRSNRHGASSRNLSRRDRSDSRDRSRRRHHHDPSSKSDNGLRR